MRRILQLTFLISLLVLPAGARETQPCAAFVIDSGPNGKYTRQLLDGLYDRGIRATFLLRGCRMAEYPQLLSRLLEDGHEAACRGFTGENMTLMSRRAIAAEILEFQALLPEGYPLALFCPPGGCSDGIRQVAEARRLAIVSWSTEGMGDVSDGDLILLRDTTAAGVQQALALADSLLNQGFELITVSELARLRSTDLKPGQTYDCFPPAAETQP